MKKPIELLQAAHEKKLLKVEFQIPLSDGEVLDAVLTAPDMYTIVEVQEIEKQALYRDYRKRGFDEEPINDADWQKEVKGMSPDLRKNMEKPENLADQLAQKYSKVRTILEIIPKHLKDKEGNPLFPTDEERSLFKDIVRSDPNLMNLLAEKYVELSSRIADLGKQAKNS